MKIFIERERNTPTPGKSPRYRARVFRSVTEELEPAAFISARNFGSVSSAKGAMDDFFGPLTWVEDYGDDTDVRASAVVHSYAA